MTSFHPNHLPKSGEGPNMGIWGEHIQSITHEELECVPFSVLEWLHPGTRTQATGIQSLTELLSQIFVSIH